MAKIYNFFDAFERDLALAEKEYEVGNRQVCLMELANAAGLEINKARSELRVMEESGEVEDLLYLVEAAKEEANANNEGIFAKAAKVIGNFFVKVANAIQKLFTGKNMEAYDKRFGKVPVGMDKLLSSLENTLSKVDAATSKGGNVIGKVAAGIAGLSGLVFGGGGVMAIYDTVKKNAKQKKLIERPMKDIHGFMTRVEALLLKAGNLLSKLPGNISSKIAGSKGNNADANSNNNGGNATAESWLGMPYGDLFVEKGGNKNKNNNQAQQNNGNAATQNRSGQANVSGSNPAQNNDNANGTKPAAAQNAQQNNSGNAGNQNQNNGGNNNQTQQNNSGNNGDQNNNGNNSDAGVFNTGRKVLTNLRSVLSSVLQWLRNLFIGDPEQFNDNGDNGDNQNAGNQNQNNGGNNNQTQQNSSGNNGDQNTGNANESVMLADNEDFDPIAAMMANLEI